MKTLGMKTLGMIGTTTLLFVLASSAPVFAQDHHEEEAKPTQHQEQSKPAAQTKQAEPAKQEGQPQAAKQEPAAKPAQQQSQAKAARPESAPKPAQQQQSAKAAGQETKAKPEQHQAQAKSTSTGTRSTPATQEKRSSGSQPPAQRTSSEQQRQRNVPALRLSSVSETRIPDARFHSSFGSGHEFRIGSPRLVGGFSRFQYGGYWFGFVQPWPEGWYYTDNVYVDFIDGGYYLCNPYYPGVHVSISIAG